eukprot:276772_1
MPICEYHINGNCTVKSSDFDYKSLYDSKHFDSKTIEQMMRYIHTRFAHREIIEQKNNMNDREIIEQKNNMNDREIIEQKNNMDDKNVRNEKNNKMARKFETEVIVDEKQSLNAYEFGCSFYYSKYKKD